MAKIYKEQKSLSLTDSPLRSDSTGINVSMLSSLGIAVIVHAFIALAIGSYVVFEGIVPVPFFNSEGIDVSSAVIDEVPTLIEDEPLPQLQTDNVQVVQEEAGGSDAPDMSDLITVTNSTLAPTFSMPTTVGNPGVITGSFLGGSGTGSGGGVGKGKVKLGSLFGSRGIAGGALTGSLYDLKQTPDRGFTAMGEIYSAHPSRRQRSPAFSPVFKKYALDWNPKFLDDFYKADVKLATTQIIMPTMDAALAPEAFNVADKVQPAGWIIRYTGEISPPRAGVYRFVGAADDILIVRIDGDDVLDGSIGKHSQDPEARSTKYPNFNGDTKGRGLIAGKWVRMRARQKYPIEIIVSEVPGGYFSAFLMVEEKGVQYEMHRNGYPVLPAFQTAPTEIPEYLDEQGFEVLKDGLVFPAH